MYSWIRQSSPLFRLIAPILIVFLVLGCILLLITSRLPSDEQPTQLARASALLADPEPTPQFLELKPAPGYAGPFADRLCYWIWDGPPLVQHHDSENYIWANTTFVLDASEIEQKSLDRFDWDMLETRDDGNGHRVEIGGPLSSCYNASLQVGLHVATVQIKSMSGQIYTYTWAFNVQSTDATLYSNAVTATEISQEATYKAVAATNSAAYATCQAAKSCPTSDFSAYASAFASEVATSVSPTSP